jgi:hypothetical protein
LSTASTSAAPSSAGPTSEQSSPSGDNSVTAPKPSTRDAGAASSNPPKQQAQQSTQQADDDPEWDFGNGQKRKRSEVLKRLSETSKGAQKSNEEAKQLKAKVEAFSKHLEKLGIDPEQFEKDPEKVFEQGAQQYITKKLEEATLDPKERELRDAKAERDRLKQEAEQRAEQERTQEHQKQVAANADAIAGHFATALKENGLPVNAKSVWLMASLLQGARKSGQRISLSDLAKATDRHVKGDLRHYLPKGDVSALKSFLGDDWSEWKEAIRKDLLAEHESKFTPKPQQSNRPEPKPAAVSSHPNGYYSLDDLRRAEAKRRR